MVRVGHEHMRLRISERRGPDSWSRGCVALCRACNFGTVGTPFHSPFFAVVVIWTESSTFVMRRLHKSEGLQTSILSLLLLSSSILARSSTSNTSLAQQPLSNYQLSSSLVSKDKCPPCFNCLLPAFTCGQYGDCDPYNGQCQCPPGWGGIDCLVPQCDSLADGNERRLREDGTECQCKDGWGGINCNGMPFALCRRHRILRCKISLPNGRCMHRIPSSWRSPRRR